MGMNGFKEFSDNYNLAAENRCKPKNFCTLSGSSCGCSLNLDHSDPAFKECDHACSNWAMKDVNCPAGGCYGVAIVFPPKFDPHGQGKPPVGSCNLKSTNTDWNQITFTPAGKTGDSSLTGKCTYTTVPTPTFCQ
jgi:hypothetical protein